MKICIIKNDTIANIGQTDVHSLLEKKVYPLLDKDNYVIREIDGSKELVPKVSQQTDALADNVLYTMNQYDNYIKFAYDLNELYADDEYDIVICYNMWHEFYQVEKKANDERVIDFLNENYDRIENKLFPMDKDIEVIYLGSEEDNFWNINNSLSTVLSHIVIYGGINSKQQMETTFEDFAEEIKDFLHKD